MSTILGVSPAEFTTALNAWWAAFTVSRPAQEIPVLSYNTINTLVNKTLQTMGVSGLVYFGIPFALNRVAKIADNYLSRPSLITEARYTNWYDQLTNAKSHNMVELFIKTIGYGACLSFGLHTALKKDLLELNTQARDLQCGLVNEWNRYRILNITPCDGSSVLSGKAQVLTSLAIGAIFAIYQGSRLLPALEFSKNIQEGMPIFAPKLSSILENIAKTTINLRQRKGFLQNILLYGPGGTGKTMMAKFLARKSDMNYVMISGGDLAQYIKLGTHVSELNKLFTKIKNASTPTILFIDEAESLCRNRSQLLNKPERLELLNAFLNHTGENSKKVLLVLATNRPEDLDPAILSRMDHKLQIDPPALAERKKILELNISKIFTPQEVALFDIEKIAKDTEGLTGRALFKMINAVFANKAVAEKELLTQDLITSIVEHFIEQEKFIARSTAPSQPKSFSTLAIESLRRVLSSMPQIAQMH